MIKTIKLIFYLVAIRGAQRSVILLLPVKVTLAANMAEKFCLNPQNVAIPSRRPTDSRRVRAQKPEKGKKKKTCKSLVIPVHQELKLEPSLPPLPSCFCSPNTQSEGGH